MTNLLPDWLKQILLQLGILAVVMGGSFLWGMHVANKRHETAELQKTVQDFVLIEAINQADSIKVVEQQREIERLKKEVANGRTKIRDGACFDAGDVDQLRNAWR